MKPLLRRILFIVLSAAVISVVGSGGFAVVKAQVVKAQSEFYGVCSQLNGFPGFLQDAGLLQTGTCRSEHWGDRDFDRDDHRDHDDRRDGCDVGRECKVEGKRGSCRSEKLHGRREICVCVANVSK